VATADESGEFALSVLIAATHDDKALRELLEVLAPQISAVGGEVLVGDGSPDGITSAPVALRNPDTDVFALRGELLSLARGRIIAMTEDHVRMPATYCEQLLTLHERHPGAEVIAGPVENGSRGRIRDWANFFCTFSAFMTPLPEHTQRCPPPVNLSLKRTAVEGVRLARGEFEFSWMPAMNAAGAVLLDDTVVVEHVQSEPFRHHVLAHFHNGRTTGGLSRAGMPGRMRARMIARSFVMPFRLFGQVYREILRRPERRRPGVLAAPFVFVLQCAHAFGEMVGYIRGPGTSPFFLH
jgi:hypothetical protein